MKQVLDGRDRHDQETPQGRLRAAKRDVTRRSLIAAAVKSFNSDGYAKSTIDDIAVRAGVTRATFYKHFSSKLELVLELQRNTETQFHPIFERLAIAVEQITVGSIRGWLLEVFNEWQAIGSASKALHEAAAVEPEVYTLLRSRTSAQAAEIAAALMRSGTPENTAQIQAIALLAPLDHFATVYMREGDFDRDLLASVLARTWVSGVKSDRQDK